MNDEQRKAVNDAIGYEKDWLYRAELECRKQGKDPSQDNMIVYHRRTLAILKEGL